MQNIIQTYCAGSFWGCVGAEFDHFNPLVLVLPSVFVGELCDFSILTKYSLVASFSICHKAPWGGYMAYKSLESLSLLIRMGKTLYLEYFYHHECEVGLKRKNKAFNNLC